MTTNLSSPELTVHTVRTVSDIVDGYRLCEQFCAERHSKEQFAKDHVLRRISQVSSGDQTRESSWVIRKNDVAIGFLYATIMQEFGLSSLSAWQHMWYVLPSERSLRPAKMLLDAFESWASEQGATRAYTTVLLDNSSDVDSFTALVKRLGYSHTGNYLAKDI